MNKRTLEEYKEEVFDKLDEKLKLEFMYEMSAKLCEIGGEYKEIKIKKWGDYDGEQIQIIGKDGDTYLVSMNNCTLINE